jgi:ATP-dependent Clp protease ATP-binding subunit ClpC
MFERFTEAARRTLYFARFLAGWDGSEAIELHHVLHGLLCTKEHRLIHKGVALVFAEFGIDPTPILQTITEGDEIASGNFSSPDPFSREVKELLLKAVEESISVGVQYTGSEHLLLAFLNQGQSPEKAALTNLGLDAQRVRDYLMTYNPDAKR